MTSILVYSETSEERLGSEETKEYKKCRKEKTIDEFKSLKN